MSENGKLKWANERRRLSDLIPWPRNPRYIDRDEASMLAESLEEFSQVETIAIGPGNELYNGHQRLNVWAEKFGDIEVDVRVSNRPLTEKEREKLTVILHRGTVGRFDFDELANEFELEDLLKWGFTEEELEIGGFDIDGEKGEVEDVEAELDTSDETGVPAQLLKNLFARESQFWPGIFRAGTDVGLGQLTENGADTTLLWNPSFYGQVCPLVLPLERCSKGYVYLEEDERQALRQALIASVNATCEECALGIDLSRAHFSVGVFAQTLLANCEQTAQVILNNVSQPPNTVASYEDLWRMTLVNYNAGPGCLGLAIQEAWTTEQSLAWDVLSNHFTEVCLPARDYVNDLSK